MSNAPTNTEKSVSASAKAPAKQPKGKGKQGANNKPAAQRVSGKPAQYAVSATVINRTVRIGDSRLAASLFRSWEGMHHALHYLTDFARTTVRGRVVTAANRGIEMYIANKIEDAQRELQSATELAEENGIVLGKPGRMQDGVVEICCRTEMDVLKLVSLMDDYVIVTDSLWISQVIDDKKRDDAHEEVCRVINTLHRLLAKMRQKMIDFRHMRMTDTLTKDEEKYALDIESLVFDDTGINLVKIRQAEEAAAAAAAASVTKLPVKPKTPNQKPEEGGGQAAGNGKQELAAA